MNFLYLVTVAVFLSVAINELSSLIRHPNLIFSLRGVAKYNMLCRGLKVVLFHIFIAFRIAEASRRDWKNIFIIRSESASHSRYLRTFEESIFDQDVSSYPTSYPTSIPSFMYNPQDNPGSKICLTLCVVVSWFNLYYYMMGFKGTGPFMLTFKRVISHDVPYFMQFFFIPLAGFALCLLLESIQY